MLFHRHRDQVDEAHRFADSAEKYQGYKAIPGHNTEFGQRTGTGGRWDGAFVWCVAEDEGFRMPSLNDPTAVLRLGTRTDRPRRGDIAVFAWNGHIGVVTNTENFHVNGEVLTVEAQVSSGLPRADRNNNGVYTRRRYYPQDIVQFIRPRFQGLPPAPENTERLPFVHASHFKPGHANHAASTELVQRALAASRYADLSNADRGKFDLQTRRALAQLQRAYGTPESEADGQPTERDLVYLAGETGLFRVRGVA